MESISEPYRYGQVLRVIFMHKAKRQRYQLFFAISFMGALFLTIGLAFASRSNIAKLSLMKKNKANPILVLWNKKLWMCFLGFFFVSMNGCDGFRMVDKKTIHKLQAQNEWVVLTTESPLIYSRAKNGETFGIDYDLLQNFAKAYGFQLKFNQLANEDAVLEALARGEGDIAAARLRTPLSAEGFQVGPAYEDTHLSLFCHTRLKVQNISDLSGRRLMMLNKDNYPGMADRLQRIVPNLQLKVLSNVKVKNLLARISKKSADCVIAENLSGDFHARHFKQIKKVSKLTTPYSLSWILAPKHSQLAQLMSMWFKQAARADEIMEVHDRYGTYIDELDRRDVLRFVSRIRSTLPTYQRNFRKAGLEHSLPWELIASVAYQESHWNPTARSYTGVRGLMQLTSATALYVGVEDRDDPAQSIWGGAKYLRFLLGQQPSELNSKDRLALALAAYNIGLAHLRDAQTLAIRLGKNPNSWRHIRQVLPLLENPDYARDLRYGMARGNETVQFVERVKSFYNVLTAHQQKS